MIAPIAKIGNAAARWVSLMGALALLLFRIVIAWGTLPTAGRRVVRRVLKDQIWFTAFQAIPLIAVLSAILSFLVISQAVQELGRIGATELIGILMTQIFPTASDIQEKFRIMAYQAIVERK
ncbi:MAG: hypothetical protein IH787_08385 [Nitrospirae bacterium]|nr:hypothetical protein [Nitrospirota bacterium]